MASRSWIEVPIEQEVWGVPDEGYAPFSFPPEGASLLFHFTEESFLRVLSALINGAALTYPDTWLQVVWDFLKNVEYPVSLCDQIAECIASNAATQAAIRDFVTGDTEINQHIQEVSTAGQPMTGPQIEALIGDSCDEDAAFGGWTALIRQMDANNRDLFERIEVGTNAIERTNLTISALPGIGLLPIDELFGFFDELLDNLVENYAAQYTTTLEDELRCDLFCLALDNDCGLNFDQLFTYFNDRIGGSFTVESLLLDILSFIGSGSWSGTQIVDAMMLLQVSILRTSSTFIDFPVYSLQKTYTLGLNDPDPDWSTLCDCGWSWTFPTDSDWTSWTLGTINGATTTIVANKLVGAQSTDTVPTIYLDAQITVSAEVGSVSFDLEYKADGTALLQQAIIQLDGVNVASVTIPPSSSPGTINVSWATGATGSHTYRIVSGVYGTVASGDYLRVVTSNWTGSGDNPFD